MLVAIGIDCQVLALDNEYVVAVSEDDVTRAARQLDLYTKENLGPTIRFTPRGLMSEGLGPAAVYGIVVFMFDMLQNRMAFSIDWFQAGSAKAGLIQQGEWWRCLTALSLHADAVHLLGNLFFGILLGLLVSQIFGYGVGWLAILAAGALGNAINAILYSPDHNSIGASTAVFGALGILAVHAWLQRRQLKQNLIRRWLPIGSALGLLAFMGTSGERTDVLAHLAGFLAGGITGYIVSIAQGFIQRKYLQRSCGALAILVVSVAWWIAVIAAN